MVASKPRRRANTFGPLSPHTLMSRADHSLPSPKSRNNFTSVCVSEYSFFLSQVTRHKLIRIQSKPVEDSPSQSRRVFGHHLRERERYHAAQAKVAVNLHFPPTTCRPAHTASEHVCMWGRVHPEAEALYLLTISHCIPLVSCFLL
jgi:hypothetical protein